MSNFPAVRGLLKSELRYGWVGCCQKQKEGENNTVMESIFGLSATLVFVFCCCLFVFCFKKKKVFQSESVVLEVGGVWNEHHMRSRAIASRGDVGVCG